MKPEIKERWLAALKSGEYVQGIHVLRDHDNRFCCLGVLCDLHAKETAIPYQEQEAYLPEQVLEWSCLSHRDQNVLAGINDKSTDFGPTIRYIEENF